jgi:hypothetical protein
LTPIFLHLCFNSFEFQTIQTEFTHKLRKIYQSSNGFATGYLKITQSNNLTHVSAINGFVYQNKFVTNQLIQQLLAQKSYAASLLEMSSKSDV